MTNPTRTRAEIQADEAAEIDQQIQALTEKRKALSACWISGYRLPDTEYGKRRVEIQMSGGDAVRPLLDDSVVCIPAADLIPREEHEAALIEANTRTDKVVLHLNARDAIRYLVKEYALDAPGEPRSYLHYHDGLEYRVTVERVDDHIPDATKKVEPADAEPVGWFAENVNGWFQTHQAYHSSVPLYRHPVNVEIVLDEYKEVADTLEQWRDEIIKAGGIKPLESYTELLASGDKL